MVKATFRYSYINAKVRAMKSRLLNRADFKNLAGVAGQDGLVECLKTTSYGEKKEHFPPSFDGMIEMYYKDLFNCYRKIIKSISGDRKRLIEHLYRKYELENLKLILRIVCSGKSHKKSEGLLLPTGESQNFSAIHLLQARSADEVLTQLKGTSYYEPLENALFRFEQEKVTFPLEMALDLSYYKGLWLIASSLGHRDQKITKKILGVQLDALNIIWIFRFKEAYLFSPEEILNYSLMQGCLLSQKTRIKLAYSVDQKDMVSNLTGTPYQGFLSGVHDPEVCYVKLLSYALSVARKNWRGFPFQIGTVLDYLLFKEIEVKDLISLTEAKRLNLSHKMVKDYLIKKI